MIVAGGIYIEHNVDPSSVVILGSGGRAALALKGVVDDVSLHAFYPAAHSDDVFASFESYGVAVKLRPSESAIHFSYLHSLAKPRVAPIPLPECGIAEVEGDLVLRFGCLEGSFRVKARRAVYDPQSGTRPDPFHANGSEADQLAVLLNAEELRALSGCRDVTNGAASVFASHKPAVVVVKAGADGAFVFARDGSFVRVPAFAAKAIYKVGSGDIFSAAFAFFWGRQDMDPAEAARRASLATANYVETRVLPLSEQPSARSPIITNAARIRNAVIVVATDTASQRWLQHEVRESLTSLGLVVVAAETPSVNPSVLFVVAAGLGASTVEQVLRRRRSGSSVVVYSEGADPAVLKTFSASGCTIERDFVTALYRTAWAA